MELGRRTEAGSRRGSRIDKAIAWGRELARHMHERLENRSEYTMDNFYLHL